MKAWMLICCSLVLAPSNSWGQGSDQVEQAVLSAKFVNLQREVLERESALGTSSLLSRIPGEIEISEPDLPVFEPQKPPAPPVSGPATSRK